MKTIKVDNVEISEEAFYKKAQELGLVKLKPKVWVPTDGEECWALCDDGDVISLAFESYCQGEFDRGLVFKTKEEALRFDQQRIAKMRVIRKLRELEDEPVDWNDTAQAKHMIKFSHKKFLRTTDYWTRSSESDLYITSISAIDWVIENMEEDLKLMFGVE